MKEHTLGKWDNLQVGHIPNKAEKINRMKSIILSLQISCNGIEEVNTIKKNILHRR